MKQFIYVLAVATFSAQLSAAEINPSITCHLGAWPETPTARFNLELSSDGTSIKSFKADSDLFGHFNGKLADAELQVDEKGGVSSIEARQELPDGRYISLTNYKQTTNPDGSFNILVMMENMTREESIKVHARAHASRFVAPQRYECRQQGSNHLGANNSPQRLRKSVEDGQRQQSVSGTSATNN